jgi:hypothetical protein
LYFDPDGAGGAQQLLFADLATGLGVSASDFLIA